MVSMRCCLRNQWIESHSLKQGDRLDRVGRCSRFIMLQSLKRHGGIGKGSRFSVVEPLVKDRTDL